MKAMITGASSGIGKECAVLLAKRGYDLILTARREDRLLELKKQLEARYSVQITVCPADLSDPNQAILLADTCLKEPVEVLINNAGFGKIGEFTKTALNDELSMIQTNVAALHILMKTFILTQKHGYILNLSSIAGHLPGPGMATYAATKAYVLSISQAVRHELETAGDPISITAYCPGPEHTEFFQRAGARQELPSISARHCAKAGIQAMFEKRAVAFSDLKTTLTQKLIRLAPTRAAVRVDYWMQQRKLER